MGRTPKICFRPLARIGGSNAWFSEYNNIVTGRFPSPLEDWGVLTFEMLDSYFEISYTFPSPREDYGGSNLKTIDLKSRGYKFPYPREDFWGLTNRLQKKGVVHHAFRPLARIRGGLTLSAPSKTASLFRFRPLSRIGGANRYMKPRMDVNYRFPYPLED